MSGRSFARRALPVLVLAVAACGPRPVPPAPEPPNVVIQPDDGTIPAPRPIPLAAEPSAAKDAIEITVVRDEAGTWKAQYPPGQRVVLGADAGGSLVVPANRAVAFVVSGAGAARFEIPTFAVDARTADGKPVRACVKPTRAGTFGVWGGGARLGDVVVVSDADFDAWLAGVGPLPGAGPVDGSLAHEGRQLFLKLQCIRCHSATPDAKAPTLEGLYGAKVKLKGGGAVIADEQYLRESIRKPKSKVVDGWEPIMPAYNAEQASEEDLNALVAYLRSLKKGGR